MESLILSNCASLKTIVIPKSVKSIKTGAFSGCNGISCVVYCGEKSDWDKISIEASNELLINATINFHDFGEWIISKNPTYSVAGEKYIICSVCGLKETSVIPVKPLGDVNEDGDVTANDLTLLKKQLFNWFDNETRFTAEDIDKYDIDRDGKIDMLDLISLKNKVIED